MSTKRNNELMKIADQVLQSGEATLLEIVNCAVALKQVVRTYNLVSQ